MDLPSNVNNRRAGEGQDVNVQDSADLFEKTEQFEISECFTLIQWIADFGNEKKHQIMLNFWQSWFFQTPK